MPEIYTFRALQLTRFVYTSYQPAALGPTVSGLVPVPGVAVAVGPNLPEVVIPRRLASAEHAAGAF